MGGMWGAAPRMGAVGLLFALASLGLPGLGNFIGEFLTLLGAWPVSVPVTAVAAVGLVASAVYSLVMFDSAFHGPPRPDAAPRDLSARDLAEFAALVLAIVWLGLFPQPVLDTARPALEGLLKAVG
jgi:NADH-quinone oxidoreductase subunit M